jgi:hypothetical protein
MGFLRNLKTKKLVRELGHEGVVCLIRLWCYTAERHPKGILVGVGIDDLEEASGWSGMRGAFASYAVRMRWVDEDGNNQLRIHDWPEHQPWLFHADKRSEAAKVGAGARWEKQNKHGVNTRRKRGASEPHATRNAPSPAPSPIPSPSPTHKDLGAERAAGVLEAPAAPTQESEPNPPNPTLPKCSTCDGPATTKINGRPKCWKCIQAENEGAAAKEACVHQWLASGVCRLCCAVREEGTIPGIGNIGAIK